MFNPRLKAPHEGHSRVVVAAKEAVRLMSEVDESILTWLREYVVSRPAPDVG
jgi:hypothetical protein